MKRESGLEVLDAIEDPKTVALLALGATISMATKAGWTLAELAALRAWPQPKNTSGRT